jgi:hypothetical protein
MFERTSHSDAMRAGVPVTHGPVTVLPIERVVLRANSGNARIWFSAAKEPCALIVRDGGGIRLIATHAVAVSLDELRRRVPGLDALLAAM